jgi:hypothetical protein
MNQELLTASLEVAVPLRIFEIRDWTLKKRMEVARHCAEVVASHGDDLQFGGKHTADAFNKLALGLAVMAYQPGGVTFMGRHWETTS